MVDLSIAMLVYQRVSGHFDECEAVFCQIIVDAVKAVKVRTTQQHTLVAEGIGSEGVWLVFPWLQAMKPCHDDWKSPFFMGKSTISMTIFNSFLYVYQRVGKAYRSLGSMASSGVHVQKGIRRIGVIGASARWWTFRGRRSTRWIRRQRIDHRWWPMLTHVDPCWPMKFGTHKNNGWNILEHIETWRSLSEWTRHFCMEMPCFNTFPTPKALRSTSWSRTARVAMSQSSSQMDTPCRSWGLHRTDGWIYRKNGAFVYVERSS